MNDNIIGEAEIIDELKAAKAMLSGHFILSSGLRSPTYLQCARVMMDAKRGEKLCSSLANKIRCWEKDNSLKIDAIVSPAMGGVVVGYEVGKQLAVDSMFCERVEGKFELRRGFELTNGQNILIVEDVVTTGKSSMEAAKCIKEYGGNPIAVASLIDRRSGNSDELKLPLISLLKLDVPTYRENELPEEMKKIPAVKPGSRDLKKKAG
ncbi:MAG: orotate phosphoribosyltransferase [Rickettsiales bacterium]